MVRSGGSCSHCYRRGVRYWKACGGRTGCSGGKSCGCGYERGDRQHRGWKILRAV